MQRRTALPVAPSRRTNQDDDAAPGAGAGAFPPPPIFPEAIQEAAEEGVSPLASRKKSSSSAVTLPPIQGRSYSPASQASGVDLLGLRNRSKVRPLNPRISNDASNGLGPKGSQELAQRASTPGGDARAVAEAVSYLGEDGAVVERHSSRAALVQSQRLTSAAARDQPGAAPAEWPAGAPASAAAAQLDVPVHHPERTWRRRLRRLVMSRKFELLCMSVIILNSICMAIIW